MKRTSRFITAAAVAAAATVLAGFGRQAAASPADYFGLHFVDADTGRGVPMVQCQLTSELRLYSDSAGYVAFDEPGLMNEKVYFEVHSYGYEAPKVGFGDPGAIETTTPGKIVEVKLKRTNIAERLYRTTGEGIYRDSYLLGKPAPIAKPLLDGKVMGQDTVETVVYNGKMLWCWGDSDRPGFPLGLFHTAGAWSKPPAQLHPESGIDYDYLVGDDGFCRAMIKIKHDTSSPIWIDGLMNVKDKAGRARLLGNYVATRDLVVFERGLLLFDDATQTFHDIAPIPMKGPIDPGGHPMRAVVDGQEYYYFPVPYPTVRVRADFEHASDPSQYEAYTCMMPGQSAPGGAVNRDGSGKLLWTWQRNTRPVDAKMAAELVGKGVIQHDETPYRLRNVENKKGLSLANGSIAWDAWAKKWVMVFGELGGKSNLGEIYVAYANAPEGPWVDARKIATHAMKNNNNDFYNPMLHGEFMQQNGRIVYFEGTLVNTFSGNPYPTPRYNYNNIMYRVDLGDRRIDLPEPPPGLSNARPSPLGP